jgi:hypothetical protein
MAADETLNPISEDERSASKFVPSRLYFSVARVARRVSYDVCVMSILRIAIGGVKCTHPFY